MGASGGAAVAGAALWAVTAWQTSAPRLGLADLGGTINFVASDWLTLAAIPPTTAVLALAVARGSVLLTLARCREGAMRRYRSRLARRAPPSAGAR